MVFDPLGGGGIGGAAVGRVVLEAAVFGRIMRRGDYDPVGQASARAVIRQDGVGDGGCGGIAAVAVHHDFDAVGGQHFEGAREGGLGERVGVHAQEQRAGCSARVGKRKWLG